MGSDEAPGHEGCCRTNEGDEEDGGDEAPGHEGRGRTDEGDEVDGSDEAPGHEGLACLSVGASCSHRLASWMKDDCLADLPLSVPIATDTVARKQWQPITHVHPI